MKLPEPVRVPGYGPVTGPETVKLTVETPVGLHVTELGVMYVVFSSWMSIRSPLRVPPVAYADPPTRSEVSAVHARTAPNPRRIVPLASPGRLRTHDGVRSRFL